MDFVGGIGEARRTHLTEEVVSVVKTAFGAPRGEIDEEGAVVCLRVGVGEACGRQDESFEQLEVVDGRAEYRAAHGGAVAGREDTAPGRGEAEPQLRDRTQRR